MRATAIGLFIVAWGGPATAQAATPMAASPDCTAASPTLPVELAGWNDRAPLTAAADPKRVARARLTPGTAADVALLPTPKVAYPVRPARPGGSVSHGGLVAFTVAQPGTYRVALGSAAWIEVLSGVTPVASTAHGQGPVCSGIRKMVDFALQPGDHLLEIAGNGTASVGVLVTQLP